MLSGTAGHKVWYHSNQLNRLVRETSCVSDEFKVCSYSLSHNICLSVTSICQQEQKRGQCPLMKSLDKYILEAEISRLQLLSHLNPKTQSAMRTKHYKLQGILSNTRVDRSEYRNDYTHDGTRLSIACIHYNVVNGSPTTYEYRLIADSDFAFIYESYYLVTRSPSSSPNWKCAFKLWLEPSLESRIEHQDTLKGCHLDMWRQSTRQNSTKFRQEN